MSTLPRPPETPRCELSSATDYPWYSSTARNIVTGTSMSHDCGRIWHAGQSEITNLESLLRTTYLGRKFLYVKHAAGC